MKVQVYTDGASRNNPGQAGIGIVIKCQGKTLLQIGEYIGLATNNIAEYTAALRGLTEAVILGAKDVELYADSELMIKQIKGEYRVKNEGLQPLFCQLMALSRKFTHFKAIHIPRNNNREADDLANLGIDSIISNK